MRTLLVAFLFHFPLAVLAASKKEEHGSLSKVILTQKTELPKISTIWTKVVAHCQNNRFHSDVGNTHRRLIDWNNGADGEIDASSGCSVNPEEWNNIDAPLILRPYFLEILEQTEAFRNIHHNPSEFVWMLRKQSIGEVSGLKFHQDDSISDKQYVTSILYDVDGVTSGGELIFATTNGTTKTINEKELYPDPEWLGPTPEPQEIAGGLHHLLTLSPKSGILVTFANTKLFHGVTKFELKPKEARFILTLLFHEPSTKCLKK
jgi:hypothetical protein